MRHLHQNPNALQVIETCLKTLRVLLIYRMCERQMDIKHVVDGGMPQVLWTNKRARTYDLWANVRRQNARCAAEYAKHFGKGGLPICAKHFGMREAFRNVRRQNARSISERVAYLYTKK